MKIRKTLDLKIKMMHNSSMEDSVLNAFEKQERALLDQLKALRSARSDYELRMKSSFQSRPELDEAGTTIKEEVLIILQKANKGLTALEILAEINENYRPNLQRETLSPQLSRLKKAGKLKSFNKIWSLNGKID